MFRRSRACTASAHHNREDFLASLHFGIQRWLFPAMADELGPLDDNERQFLLAPARRTRRSHRSGAGGRQGGASSGVRGACHCRRAGVPTSGMAASPQEGLSSDRKRTHRPGDARAAPCPNPAGKRRKTRWRGPFGSCKASRAGKRGATRRRRRYHRRRARK